MKVDCAVNTPGVPVPVSVTVNVNCVGPPFILPNGVTVTVQFGAVPATTIPDTGMIAVLEDETVIPVVQLTVESISVIVNANAEVAASSLIV